MPNRRTLFTDESAEQVAAALGFRDPSYFARFFRRRTGVSPARFRETGRQAAELARVASGERHVARVSSIAMRMPISRVRSRTRFASPQ